MLLYIEGDTPHLAHVVSDEGAEHLKRFLARHDFPSAHRVYKLWPFYVADLRGSDAWRLRKLAHGIRSITWAHLDKRCDAVRRRIAEKGLVTGKRRDQVALVRARKNRWQDPKILEARKKAEREKLEAHLAQLGREEEGLPQ